MKRNKKLILIISIAFVLISSVVGVSLYLLDYYRADSASIAAFSQNIIIEESKSKNYITYGTGNEENAFIFYPGGKVEYTSYVPLMRAISQKGIFCILVKMPANLAVLNIDAASDIRKKYINIDNWYIGGHSLGGSMAASYLGKNSKSYKGLVLLGAYSTEDLSETQLDVLSIYGSEDRVMNLEKYNKYITNLPNDFKEDIISGGCHAYFGMYGEQDGDGTPAITAQEQIQYTADSIIKFINKN